MQHGDELIFTCACEHMLYCRWRISYSCSCRNIKASLKSNATLMNTSLLVSFALCLMLSIYLILILSMPMLLLNLILIHHWSPYTINHRLTLTHILYATMPPVLRAISSSAASSSKAAVVASENCSSSSIMNFFGAVIVKVPSSDKTVSS